ncbi:hypothetical protein OG599_10340 [Streptomyces sp. NBC_01335]|uniref:hypothetical protein n=1 Tax=Streptomyces sp. NBC_01335 TaxID=2903828 RepID=UPI002E0D6378|nr:hypothetical protein OG599_10340 [Streptomyces sp. NBC_01335]
MRYGRWAVAVVAVGAALVGLNRCGGPEYPEAALGGAVSVVRAASDRVVTAGGLSGAARTDDGISASHCSADRLLTGTDVVPGAYRLTERWRVHDLPHHGATGAISAAAQAMAADGWTVEGNTDDGIPAHVTAERDAPPTEGAAVRLTVTFDAPEDTTLRVTVAASCVRAPDAPDDEEWLPTVS